MFRPDRGAGPRKKGNPQGSPWGKRKAVFSVCRVKTVGSTEEEFPLLTLGLAGYGGASIRHQLKEDWRQTWTPGEMRATITGFRGSGVCSMAHKNHTPAPGASLHPARSPGRCVRPFAKSVRPGDHVGETSGIPSTSPASFPSVLHPEGLRFLGAPPGRLAH